MVDGESIHSDSMLEQSIHPGPQSHPQGISTSYHSVFNRERKDSCGQETLSFSISTHTRLKPLP